MAGRYPNPSASGYPVPKSSSFSNGGAQVNPPSSVGNQRPFLSSAVPAANLLPDFPNRQQQRPPHQTAAPLPTGSLGFPGQQQLNQQGWNYPSLPQGPARPAGPVASRVIPSEQMNAQRTYGMDGSVPIPPQTAVPQRSMEPPLANGGPSSAASRPIRRKLNYLRPPPEGSMGPVKPAGMMPLAPGVPPAPGISSGDPPGYAATAGTGPLVAGMQGLQVGGRPIGMGDYAVRKEGHFPSGILPEDVRQIPLNNPSSAPRPEMSSSSAYERLVMGDVQKRPKKSGSDVTMGPVGPRGPTGLEISRACPDDLLIPVSDRCARLSVGAFPNNDTLAKKYSLPLGAVIQPLAKPLPGEQPVPVINFGASGIMRCRRCRTYINFACSFLNEGRRWKCSICQFIDEVPPDYFSPLDQNGKRQDAAQRPELHRGTIEIVAPSDYMVRPPMPAVFIFVLEVTPAAAATGALANMVAGIRRAVTDFSGDGREKVAVLTFDSTVHFHSLREGPDGESSVTIVPDVDDMFLPSPERLLVSLGECKPALERLLDAIPNTYAPSMAANALGSDQNGPARIVSSASCLGAAIEAAYKVGEHLGGKVILFTATRPTSGPGRLRDRGDPAALGTDRELGILRPEKDWYRTKGVEFTKRQLTCDLFVAMPPPGYFLDLGTLAQLAKYTGGEVFFASPFDAARDGSRLQMSVYRNIVRETGLEAVMRIRITRGVRCAKFSGRFFLRASDLMALPSCDEDKAYGVEFSFEETAISKTEPFCMQVALLYTTTHGERRIRVHTVASPVTTSALELFNSADAAVSSHLLLRQAAEAVKNRRLEEIKKSAMDKLVMSLALYRKECIAQHGSVAMANRGHLLLPESMLLMPLYMNGMFKNRLMSRAASGAFTMRFDEKAAVIHTIDVLNVGVSCAFLYPNMFAVYPTPKGVTKSDKPQLVPIPPSMAVLKSNIGVLVDDGMTLFLWIGSDVLTKFIGEVSSKRSAANVSAQMLEMDLTSGARDNQGLSVMYIKRVIDEIRAHRGSYIPFFVVPAASKMQARVEALMMEDRSTSNLGYVEFLRELHRQIEIKAVK